MFLVPGLVGLLSLSMGVSAQFDVDYDDEDSTALPWGCGFAGSLVRPYTLLCDLEAAWGVAVEAAALGGALAAILLALVLLCRLRGVGEAEKRSGVGPLLLLLLGILGLFGLSFAYLVEASESVCLVRRALWGLFHALCFACLLAQGVRLRRLTRERRSPSGCALSGLAAALTGVQAIVAAEWLLLTVARQGQAACAFEPLDFALACGYVVALLLAATVMAGAALACGGSNGNGGSGERRSRAWRCSAIWLLVACLLSMLLWAAWLGFYLYGNDALGQAPAWDAPALAVALVTQGWLLLLCHAAPEAHACMRPPPQPSAPDYFDTSHNSARLRQTSFDEDIPLSHRQFVDSQGYAFDDSNAAGLRSGSGSHASGPSGPRPSAPFRSNVYQPTEMTMILNGGAVPSAPPSRQLW